MDRNRNNSNPYLFLIICIRIAAAKSSPWRHDQACPIPTINTNKLPDNDRILTNVHDNEKVLNAIQKLRNVLEMSHFDNQHVQQLFDIPPKEQLSGINLDELKKEYQLAFATSPIFLKPQRAGSQFQLPPLLDELLNNDDEVNEKQKSSLKCLVTLFSLGFAGTMRIVSHIIKLVFNHI